MPTYHYRCPSCHHEFEQFQSITEDPIEICPNCNEKTHRVISGGGGFVLKGTGFYQTDYRSSQYQADAKKDTSSDSSNDSKKSETKKPDSNKTSSSSSSKPANTGSSD